jgi:hypothetical protein
MNSIKVNDYALQICSTQEDLTKVAKLRYHCYKNVNAIQENEKQEFTDRYDFQNNAKSCMVYEEDQLIGSIRACVYSPSLNFDFIPAFETYKEDIRQAIGLDKVIVESNRFVISSEKAESKNLFKIPFRFIVLNINKYDGDYIVTAVRERHVPLYRRFLTLEPISKPKRYPGLDVDMVLLAGDCKKGMRDLVQREEIYAIPQNEIENYSL